MSNMLLLHGDNDNIAYRTLHSIDQIFKHKHTNLHGAVTFVSVKIKQSIIHLHYCQKKNISNNIAKPPIGRDEVPDINPALNDRPRQGTLYEQQSDVHVWGEHTLKDLEQVINAVYEEVAKWRKNTFLLPSGAAGKSYIRETTRLIDAWNKNSEVLKNVAVKAVMIMPHLLLQKPSFKAKSKEHSISLSRRMIL